MSKSTTGPPAAAALAAALFSSSFSDKDFGLVVWTGPLTVVLTDILGPAAVCDRDLVLGMELPVDGDIWYGSFGISPGSPL